MNIIETLAYVSFDVILLKRLRWRVTYNIQLITKNITWISTLMKWLQVEKINNIIDNGMLLFATFMVLCALVLGVRSNFREFLKLIRKIHINSMAKWKRRKIIQKMISRFFLFHLHKRKFDVVPHSKDCIDPIHWIFSLHLHNLLSTFVSVLASVIA